MADHPAERGLSKSRLDELASRPGLVLCIELSRSFELVASLILTTAQVPFSEC